MQNDTKLRRVCHSTKNQQSKQYQNNKINNNKNMIITQKIDEARNTTPARRKMQRSYFAASIFNIFKIFQISTNLNFFALQLLDNFHFPIKKILKFTNSIQKKAKIKTRNKTNYFNNNFFKLIFLLIIPKGQVQSLCYKKLSATKDWQTFTSPQYPIAFPPNTRCIYRIEAPVGYNVRLEFIDFLLLEKSPGSIPPNGRCENQALTVLNINAHNNDPVTILCGNTKPVPMISRNQGFNIELNSNNVPYNYNYKGFQIKYKIDGLNIHKQPSRPALGMGGGGGGLGRGGMQSRAQLPAKKIAMGSGGLGKLAPTSGKKIVPPAKVNVYKWTKYTTKNANPTKMPKQANTPYDPKNHYCRPGFPCPKDGFFPEVSEFNKKSQFAIADPRSRQGNGNFSVAYGIGITCLIFAIISVVSVIATKKYKEWKEQQDQLKEDSQTTFHTDLPQNGILKQNILPDAGPATNFFEVNKIDPPGSPATSNKTQTTNANYQLSSQSQMTNSYGAMSTSQGSNDTAYSVNNLQIVPYQPQQNVGTGAGTLKRQYTQYNQQKPNLSNYPHVRNLPNRTQSFANYTTNHHSNLVPQASTKTTFSQALVPRNYVGLTPIPGILGPNMPGKQHHLQISNQISAPGCATNISQNIYGLPQKAPAKTVPSYGANLLPDYEIVKKPSYNYQIVAENFAQLPGIPNDQLQTGVCGSVVGGGPGGRPSGKFRGHMY